MELQEKNVKIRKLTADENKIIISKETQKDENGNVIPHVPHPDSFTKKKPWQRIIVLVAGALMNYLLALLLITVNLFSYGQTMVAVYEAEPTCRIKTCSYRRKGKICI